MGFTSGSATVSSTAASVMSPRAASAVTFYNQGSANVTIGGPNVVWGQGVILVAGALPLAIQATHFGNVEDVDDSIWAVTQAAGSGNATLGWIHGY